MSTTWSTFLAATGPIGEKAVTIANSLVCISAHYRPIKPNRFYFFFFFFKIAEKFCALIFCENNKAWTAGCFVSPFFILWYLLMSWEKARRDDLNEMWIWNEKFNYTIETRASLEKKEGKQEKFRKGSHSMTSYRSCDDSILTRSVSKRSTQPLHNITEW